MITGFTPKTDLYDRGFLRKMYGIMPDVATTLHEDTEGCFFGFDETPLGLEALGIPKNGIRNAMILDALACTGLRDNSPLSIISRERPKDKNSRVANPSFIGVRGLEGLPTTALEFQGLILPEIGSTSVQVGFCVFLSAFLNNSAHNTFSIGHTMALRLTRVDRASRTAQAAQLSMQRTFSVDRNPENSTEEVSLTAEMDCSTRFFAAVNYARPLPQTHESSWRVAAWEYGTDNRERESPYHERCANYDRLVNHTDQEPYSSYESGVIQAFNGVARMVVPAFAELSNGLYLYLLTKTGVS